MKKVIRVFLGLVIIHALSSTALAETPETLKGTWVVDAKATEEFLKSSPPPKPRRIGFRA